MNRILRILNLRDSGEQSCLLKDPLSTKIFVRGNTLNSCGIYLQQSAFQLSGDEQSSELVTNSWKLSQHVAGETCKFRYSQGFGLQIGKAEVPVLSLCKSAYL
jgi:hypothetical protein